MKKQQWHLFLKLWLLRFLQLQLFISLVSLPILIAWGLPLSVVSPIANLIFSPMLTLFLFISSLLFFTELFCIPNQWLAWSLNNVTHFWYNILNCHTHSWLYGFVKPSPWILCIIPTLAFLIIYNKNIKKPMQTIVAFSLLFFGIALASHIQGKKNGIYQIPAGKRTMTLINNQATTILIDPGAFNTQANLLAWISYTLIPYLVQKTGQLKVDYVIAKKPSARTFEAIKILCSKIKINQVYLPYWTGTLPKYAWKQFFLMKEALGNKSKITRIGNHDIILPLEENSIITITSTKKIAHYNQASFSQINIYGTIGNKSIEV